jgi:hypothetical protein
MQWHGELWIVMPLVDQIIDVLRSGFHDQSRESWFLHVKVRLRIRALFPHQDQAPLDARRTRPEGLGGMVTPGAREAHSWNEIFMIPFEIDFFGGAGDSGHWIGGLDWRGEEGFPSGKKKSKATPINTPPPPSGRGSWAVTQDSNCFWSLVLLTPTTRLALAVGLCGRWNRPDSFSYGNEKTGTRRLQNPCRSFTGDLPSPELVTCECNLSSGRKLSQESPRSIINRFRMTICPEIHPMDPPDIPIGTLLRVFGPELSTRALRHDHRDASPVPTRGGYPLVTGETTFVISLQWVRLLLR